MLNDEKNIPIYRSFGQLDFSLREFLCHMIFFTKNLDDIIDEYIKLNFGEFSVSINVDFFPNIFDLIIARLLDSESGGDSSQKGIELTLFQESRAV
jgi:hypothetical protein